MINSGFYSKKEISNLNLKKVGKDCVISNLTRFYSKNVIIGNRCRIDDDVVFKGKIILGDNVHLARGCTLSGGNKGIELKSFAAISNFVQFFASSDDYLNPYIPAATLNENLKSKFSKIYESKITIGKSVLIGSMSCILPGTVMMDFSSAGAFSLIYGKISKGTFVQSFKNDNIQKKRNFKEISKKFDNINKILNNNDKIYKKN